MAANRPKSAKSTPRPRMPRWNYRGKGRPAESSPVPVSPGSGGGLSGGDVAEPID